MSENPLSRRRFFALSGMISGAVAGVAGGLLPVAARAEPHSPVNSPLSHVAESEIQRYCSNISDAARDRRYQIQAKELEALQADIDTRIVALEAKRQEYEDWLKRREDFLAKAEDGVVAIYSKMRPDAAAERLAELETEVAAGILMKLETRKAGFILNEMDRKSAALVTTIMVSATRKEDPS